MNGDTIDNTNYIFAGFWRRVPAWLIDVLIVAFGTMVIDIGFLIVQGIPLDAVFYTQEEGASLGFGYNPTSFGKIFGTLFTILYFVLFESSRFRATPGKMAMGLIVVDEQGRTISKLRAFGRWAGKILSAAILMIGYFMAGWTARKQALHDLMAGCLVLKRSSMPGTPMVSDPRRQV